MTIDAEQYWSDIARAKAQLADDIVKLDIKRWGACPNYKGHFDGVSCGLGVAIGWVAGVVICCGLLFVAGFHR